jgi:catechol 2,3-dioxygenase-like lactoylglutathione lyase family enzyme
MTGMPPNFVIVTLGVSDLDRSIAFYRALGWELHGDRAQGIVWFRTSGTWLGLFPHEELAGDAGLPGGGDLPPFRGITLAVNLADEPSVDAAFKTWSAAGGTVVAPATRTEWGGYSGYVADLDGHLWELCFNPGFPLDEQGRIEIP